MSNDLLREKYIRSRLLMLLFGEATLLLPLALAFSHGLISPRVLGWIAIAASVVFGAAFLWILRHARTRFPDTEPPDTTPLDAKTLRKARRVILLLKVGVVFFALNLVYGLYQSRGDRWSAILTGVSVNLLIQALLIRGIVVLQRKLRQRGG